MKYKICCQIIHILNVLRELSMLPGNNLTEYMDAMLRSWVMFLVFRRHHYDKAPLVWLSNILYWKRNNHPLYHVLMQNLQIIDEYGVENFHSILRAQTNATHTPEQISRKAREISATRGVLRDVKTQLLPPKSVSLSHNQLKHLKLKAAEFLVKKFKEIHENPGSAKSLPRIQGQRRNIKRWSLPLIFGDKVVDNKVLPMGFSATKPPDPER